MTTWIIIGRYYTTPLERMATVMVITCPHALGLAIPLVVAVSTSKAVKNGLLIRNRNAFENAHKIDVIAFDKTGTLTEGNFGVDNIRSFKPKVSNQEIIRIAASIETYSEHPISLAIRKHASDQNIQLSETSDFEAIKGKGVKALVDSKEYFLLSENRLLITVWIFPKRKAQALLWSIS